MRPLFHPSIDDVTVESIMHALSDPVRAAIYLNIAASDFAQNCSNFLRVSEKDVPKSTLSQHFKALREAGLIRGERRGVEMHNTSRCAELENRFPGLIPAIINAHKVQGSGKARAAAARVKGERLAGPESLEAATGRPAPRQGAAVKQRFPASARPRTR